MNLGGLETAEKRRKQKRRNKFFENLAASAGKDRTVGSNLKKTGRRMSAKCALRDIWLGGFFLMLKYTHPPPFLVLYDPSPTPA
jgi:hypothetical protein